MALLVYKISDYNHTAEREQYREVCKLLKSVYSGKPELCVFIANYNIFDSELDGILIKEDAIVAIEFKNYGGAINAVENGHWTTDDGTIIKGGSRKSVYQQAKLNHVAMKRGLKEGGILPSKSLRNIPTLICFHKPIHLNNQLSAKVQSWLYICDETSFLDKVYDITSEYLSLSNNDIMSLIDKLNLTDFLDETYSDKDVVTESDKDEVISTTTNQNITKQESQSTEKLDEIADTPEIIGLKNFLAKIMDILLKGKTYSIRVMDYDSFMGNTNIDNPEFAHHYIVKVDAENISENAKKISGFINRNLYVLNSNCVYWSEPIENEAKFDNTSKQENPCLPPKANNRAVSKQRKNKTTLPHWLDKYIFGVLQAKYAPEYSRFDYNLDLNDSELQVYLGTYFPRSYAELFCIASNLFENNGIEHIYELKEEINILDFGCGTAGDLLGLLVAIGKYNPQIKKINITAVDGSNKALDILGNIISEYKRHCGLEINIHFQQTVIYSAEYKLNISGDAKLFDFIICSKIACELKSHNIIESAYSWLVNILAPLLNNSGILILLDVTTKNEKTGFYYPQEMNKEVNPLSVHSSYSILIPLACSLNSDCNDACFMQQCFSVSHSHRSGDESKVCYKVICSNELYNTVYPRISEQYSHVILSNKQKDEETICSKMHGEKSIDSFNLNL